MELHAVWNRIDQLEKLIISQAKEIDSLRRAINSNQNLAQNANLNSAGNTCNHSNLDNMKAMCNHKPLNVPVIRPPLIANGQCRHHPSPTPTTTSQLNSNKLLATRDFNKSNILLATARNRVSTPPMTYKNYFMNPFVHPANAIPPVADRIILRTEACDNYPNAAGKKSPEMNNITAVHRRAIKNNHHLNYGLSLPMDNRAMGPGRPLPPNVRWSTGPSLLAGTNTTSSAFTNDLEQDEQSQSASAKRRANKLSLIELITCFCPCFSMC